MDEKRRAHLFDVEHLAQSVLRGQEVTAACGVKRRYKREDFDDIPEKACQQCLIACQKENNGEVHYKVSEGWTAILERAYLSVTSPKFSVYTSTNVSRFTISWGSNS